MYWTIIWLGVAIFQFCLSCDSNLSTENDEIDSIADAKHRYLPEFNITPDNYKKWSKYLDQIKWANQKFLSAEDFKQIVKLPWHNLTCGVFLDLAETDLSYYERLFGQNFITKQLVQEMVQSKRAVHYQIIDHRLYRDKACMFPSRCEGIEHFILPLVSSLPNMDIFINVRDYPQVGKFYQRSQQFPIFSFSKDVTNYADITYPAWTFWSGGPALDLYPKGIGRWDLTRESILKKQSEIPWSKKIDIAFFRGSRTSSKRDPIVLLSRSNPKLIDAKYTKNQAWKSKEDTLGEEPASTVSFEQHCQYKYLFNAHGVAASFRLKHLYLCRSLVLNVNSSWIEFFYPPLKPWIHFVPISSDYHDVEMILHFLSDNQPIAAHIAKRGFQFIRDHLTMSSCQCYWKYVLESYSNRLITYRPDVVDPDLIEIKVSK